MSTTKRDWKERIYPKFYHAEHERPTVRTVGELKAILSELPNDLPVKHEFGNATEVVVFNVGHDDCHLEFREPEDDFDDEE